MGGERVVEIVGILERVGQREGGLERPVEIGQAIDDLVVDAHGIVAEVPELDLGAENARRLLRLGAPDALDLVERHFALAPKLGQLAALAIGQAHDDDAIATLGVQCDRAAGAPDEIRRMRAHHQCALAGFGHGPVFLVFRSAALWRTAASKT